MSNKREKTDSVTHLVKIVAEEVANEVFDKRIEEIQRQSCLPKPIDTSNTGGRWTEKEDKQLNDELSNAICEIAELHRRTFGSIKARIRKSLLEI